jgi:glycosyltransferase involved in cell wall biosynthesis
MTTARATLTALVLARNEEERLAVCLEHVRWADQLLVVDDMSTDRTAEISRRYGATVVQRAFDNFSDQGNFGLRHATGDWVISLDADELVTPEFRQEIEAVLRSDGGHAGFTFKRLNFFLGRRMRYGGWYHDVLHLFRRDAGKFAGKVHHTPQLTGTIGRLKGHVEHRPFKRVSQFLERQNRYTTMEAQEWLELRGPAKAADQREQLVRRPLKLFWKMYVKKQGWREAFPGFLFSALYAWLDMIRWAKYWELSQSEANGAAPAVAAEPPSEPMLQPR